MNERYFGKVFNRPFPSSLSPLCQNKSSCWNHSVSKCVSLQVYFHVHQTHFHMKGFARRLVLWQRRKVTRKLSHAQTFCVKDMAMVKKGCVRLFSRRGRSLVSFDVHCSVVQYEKGFGLGCWTQCTSVTVNFANLYAMEFKKRVISQLRVTILIGLVHGRPHPFFDFPFLSQQASAVFSSVLDFVFLHSVVPYEFFYIVIFIS